MIEVIKEKQIKNIEHKIVLYGKMVKAKQGSVVMDRAGVKNKLEGGEPWTVH